MPGRFLPVLTWVVKGALGLAILGSLVSLGTKLRTLALAWVAASV